MGGNKQRKTFKEKMWWIVRNPLFLISNEPHSNPKQAHGHLKQPLYWFSSFEVHHILVQSWFFKI